jgi:hypothetical protein
VQREIDLSSIDLNLLVLFEAVMQERHIARTGKRLHLSPSAVSHGLSRLRLTLHDPLFLKHPKGVVPTARAEELAAPIADILQRVRSVLVSAEGFDAARSTRRFIIGAPDAVFMAVVPTLLGSLAKLGLGRIGARDSPNGRVASRFAFASVPRVRSPIPWLVFTPSSGVFARRRGQERHM